MSITIAVYHRHPLLGRLLHVGQLPGAAAGGVLGATSMISLGLLVAARVASEEFAGGLLNLVSWPMMFLSGVWFSLEGAPWLYSMRRTPASDTALGRHPRRHAGRCRRRADLCRNLLALAAMSALFLALGAISFKWKND